ncbi:hypothetical protein SB773_19495 [Bacillus sp. SIMBA_074]|uniref:hypothetical protein n=1 Tax=Bacillus sp. SIMBA_074 TaxID=3085812 RepID=UPI003979BB60
MKHENTYGLKVKKASNGEVLRYLIVEDGIPVPEVCLWLDFVSINSYLTGERYAYTLLRYLRYLKGRNIHYKNVTRKGVIEEYELQSPIFKKSIKGDKVLVFSKSWAPILKSGAIYRKKKSTKIESENYMLKRLIIDFIVEKVVTNKDKLSEVKEWINNHKKIITLNSILIGILRNGMISEEKVKLKDFINNLLSEKSVGNINTRNQLFEKIEAVLSPSVGEVSSKVDEDDIFTIHSVKGETLRSALVVDFDDKPLTKILLHKYGVYEEGNYLYTNNNLLYVAMSRVTHLFVFAMHKDDCTNEVYNGMKSGWMIKSI